MEKSKALRLAPLSPDKGSQDDDKKVVVREYPFRYTSEKYNLTEKPKEKQSIVDPTIFPTGRDDGRGPGLLVDSYINKVLDQPAIRPHAVVVQKEFFSDTFNQGDFDFKMSSVELQAIPYQSAIRIQQSRIPKNSADQKKFFLRLADHLRNSDPSIVRLRLSNMNINDHVLRKLCAGLVRNKYVQFLMLHHNRITDVGVEELCSTLHFHPQCHTLWLASNLVTDVGMRHLAELLHWNHRLKELNVSTQWPSALWAPRERALHPHITFIGAEYLVRFLKKGAGLTSLSLAHQRLRDDGASLLFDVLSTHPLRSLNLADNLLTDRATTSLSRALNADVPLEELVLSENDLTSAGAASLSVSLCRNSQLRALDLSRNLIGNRGLFALYRCLRFNSTLQSLVTVGNKRRRQERREEREKEKKERGGEEGDGRDSEDEEDFEAHAEAVAAKRNRQSFIGHRVDGRTAALPLDNDQDDRSTTSATSANSRKRPTAREVRASLSLPGHALPVAAAEVHDDADPDHPDPGHRVNHLDPSPERRPSVSYQELRRTPFARQSSTSKTSLVARGGGVHGRRSLLHPPADPHPEPSSSSPSSSSFAPSPSQSMDQSSSPLSPQKIAAAIAIAVRTVEQIETPPLSARSSLYRRSLSNSNSPRNNSHSPLHRGGAGGGAAGASPMNNRVWRAQESAEEEDLQSLGSLGSAEDLAVLRKERQQRRGSSQRRTSSSSSGQTKRKARNQSLNPFTLTPEEMQKYLAGEMTYDPYRDPRKQQQQQQQQPVEDQEAGTDSALVAQGSDIAQQQQVQSADQQQQSLRTPSSRQGQRRRSTELGKTLGVPRVAPAGTRPIRSSISSVADSGQHLLYLKVVAEDDPPNAPPVSLVRIGLDREQERQNLRQQRQDPVYRAEKAIRLMGDPKKQQAADQHRKVITVPDRFWRSWHSRTHAMYPEGIDHAPNCKSTRLEPIHIPPPPQNPKDVDPYAQYDRSDPQSPWNRYLEYTRRPELSYQRHLNFRDREFPPAQVIAARKKERLEERKQRDALQLQTTTSK